MSPRAEAEIRTEFTAVNTQIDHSTARADELSRRIDDNGRRIDRLTAWRAALAKRLTKIDSA